MNDDVVLRANQLRISAAGRRLVHDVSLTVSRGESVALVGESGSGKSLTARALVALLPQGLTSSGEVCLGADVIDLAAPTVTHRGAGVGLLLQDPFTMLNPMMTAGAHIRETLLAAGSSRRDAASQVTRRLAEVGISDPAVAHRYPFELSGGMSQRVALAAALANDPSVLVADEPTTALDATTQHEVLDLLSRVQHQRGMALILITHDLRLAFSVCDRVMVMYAGSIVEESPSDDVRRAPRHPYTAGLLAAVPSIEHYQERLVGIDGAVPSADTVADRCAFADRCAHQEQACVSARPPLIEIAPGRLSACRRASELTPPGQDTAVGHRTAPRRDEPVPTVLRVDGLRKSYGRRGSRHVAVDGVSFSLAPGEALGIVGESGSGKTTIARCLLGLTVADSGNLEVAGLHLGERAGLNRQARAAAARAVQCVFQDPYSTLNPMHTVRYALGEALARRARPVEDAATEVGNLLRRVGLPVGLADRRPVALSGGQRQRVAIARALAVEPQVLLCDEPVAALDVSVQAQVLELLREVHRAGTSLLFITHDLGVVRQVTDRVLVLHRGVVVEQGLTADVLDEPRHEYTRRLVASMLRLDDVQTTR